MIETYEDKPMVVIWEATQACELACVHCRASAQPKRHPLELETDEAKRLIDDIAYAGPEVFVITGGDPLMRPDLFELVAYATRRGLRTSVTPSVTSLLTPDAIVRLRDSGTATLAVSLDGATAAMHDEFRGVQGAFDATLAVIRSARAAGLPVQINTTFSARNIDDADALMQLLGDLDICLWSVFFLVPTGRGEAEEALSADAIEELFGRLFAYSRRVTFPIKTTEAPHYRRFVMQQAKGNSALRPKRRMVAVNDGKGFVFVSHLGEIYPSGFLPIPSGSVRNESLLSVYRNSPLFRDLRDADKLEGKCGRCEFRRICGGSRARAFAVSGNAFAEDESCSYIPPLISERSGAGGHGRLPTREFPAAAR